jgi:hypothetical protein
LLELGELSNGFGYSRPPGRLFDIEFFSCAVLARRARLRTGTGRCLVITRSVGGPSRYTFRSVPIFSLIMRRGFSPYSILLLDIESDITLATNHEWTVEVPRLTHEYADRRLRVSHSPQTPVSRNSHSNPETPHTSPSKAPRPSLSAGRPSTAPSSPASSFLVPCVSL